MRQRQEMLSHCGGKQQKFHVPDAILIEFKITC